MAGEGVKVSHEALQSQAQKLGASQNELEAKLSEIKAQIGELVSSGFVTESASDSFAQAQADWDNAARACVAKLQEMASYLGKASQAFKDVDQAFTVKL